MWTQMYDYDELNRLVDQMTSSYRNTMTSSIMLLLERYAGASWKGNEILKLRKTNGSEVTVAKREVANVKSQRGGATQAVNRILFSPKALMLGEDYEHTQKILRDLPVGTAPTVLQEVLETAALYVAAMPNFKQYEQSWDSFVEYQASYAAFEQDINAFYALSETQLTAVWKHKLDIIPGPNIRFALLERALGFTGSPIISLREILQTHTVLQTATTGAKPMAEQSTTGTSVQKRLLQGLQKGAATGAIGAVNRKTADLIIDKLGAAAPEFLKTEIGHKLIEGAIPAFVLFILGLPQVGGRLPESARKQAEKIAEMAWDDFSRDSASKAIDALFEIAGPLLNEYVQAGGMLGLADTSTEAEGDLFDVTPQQQREREPAIRGL